MKESAIGRELKFQAQLFLFEEIGGVVSTKYDQICRKDCPAADTPEVTPFVEVRILNVAHDPKIFNGLGRARRDTKCPPFWLTDP